MKREQNNDIGRHDIIINGIVYSPKEGSEPKIAAAVAKTFTNLDSYDQAYFFSEVGRLSSMWDRNASFQWADMRGQMDKASMRVFEDMADQVLTDPLDGSFVEFMKSQHQFSKNAFGPGARLNSTIDHIKKELIEVEASGGSIEEWIDVIILAIDGALRSGASPWTILREMWNKLEINRGRDWPNWKDADPDKAIEHIK